MIADSTAVSREQSRIESDARHAGLSARVLCVCNSLARTLGLPALASREGGLNVGRFHPK